MAKFCSAGRKSYPCEENRKTFEHNQIEGEQHVSQIMTRTFMDGLSIQRNF